MRKKDQIKIEIMLNGAITGVFFKFIGVYEAWYW